MTKYKGENKRRQEKENIYQKEDTYLIEIVSPEIVLLL